MLLLQFFFFSAYCSHFQLTQELTTDVAKKVWKQISRCESLSITKNILRILAHSRVAVTINKTISKHRCRDYVQKFYFILRMLYIQSKYFFKQFGFGYLELRLTFLFPTDSCRTGCLGCDRSVHYINFLPNVFRPHGSMDGAIWLVRTSTNFQFKRCSYELWPN